MKDIEAVAILKQTYPGMSKSVLSMGKKPEYYGVELTALAKSKLGMRKIDRRRKPYRITFRLTEADYEQFELARGADTRQTFAEAIIKNYLAI